MSTGAGSTFASDQTITLALAGTATEDDDYTIGSKSLTLPAGVGTTVTRAWTDITSISDRIDEADETILITATHDSATFGSQQTVTIRDDDARPVLSLAVSPATIAEAAGRSTVTVSTGRGSTFDTDQTITLTLSGSATENDDYTIVSKSLTLPAEASSVTTRITAVQDRIDEADETVRVNASHNGGNVGSRQTVTITDDDPAPALSSVSLNNAAIAEDGGTSTLTLSTNGSVFTSDQTITLTLAGTATKDTDYTISAESLTLAAGETSVTATVTAVQDAIDDDAETVVITASHNSATIGTSQTITITDDDDAPALSIAVDPASIAEAAGTSTVTVSTGTPFTADQTISLTLGGTATVTSDYTLSDTSLTLTAGETSVTATVTAVQDTIDEPDETVIVSASNGGTAIGSATVTITDDDANSAPVLDNAIPDQSAVAGTGFSYQVPADAFSDPDSDTLSYAATQADGMTLPTWLGFTAGTRTFAGTPAATDVETVSVKVTATDTSSATVSDEFNIVVAAVAPDAPTSLTATASGSTTINLSWTAPASTGGSAITGYKIEISSDGGSSWTDLVANTASTTTTYEHTGLAASTTRHYRVSAINSIGTGTTASDVASATTGTPANTAATGAPAITGTAQVGQMLTATVGTIADANGLPDPFLTDTNTSIQWIRVATDNTETNIASATSSTYTLVADDLGAMIKVKVSFTDDASNAETLTSAATAAVVAASTDTTAPEVETITIMGEVMNRAYVDGVTVTVHYNEALDENSAPSGGFIVLKWFQEDDPDLLDTGDFTVPSYYCVAGNSAGGCNRELAGVAIDGSTVVLTLPEIARMQSTDSVALQYSVTHAVNPIQDLAGNQALSRISQRITTINQTPPNTAATGAATIDGTAQVGETLTAATTTIMDADGLNNVSYTYQWIRVATDNSETNIASATASTYTLVTADQGTTIKVKVSFTDDANNDETLTSVATAAVVAAPNTPPSASDGTVTTNEDTARTFAAADFNFLDTDPGDTLESVEIITLPASGTGTLALSGTPVTAGQEIAEADIGTLTYTPPANANGTGYASFTFKVNDGTVDSSSAYTMTINVTAVNDAPTVATAIPDQTATAGTAFRYAGSRTTTFSDADTGDMLSYAATQADGTNLPTWLGFTAGTRTFAGTPAATDVETVSVTVTATDTNSGTVSDDFDIVVSAAPNAAPTASNGTVTTNEDTDHTFAAANFNFADTDSGDSLSSVKIVTLPAGGQGTLTLNTANVSATAAVTKAQLDSGHFKYTPPANANGTGYASFTFKVNDGTVDSSSAYTMTINVTAVNDAPTVATAIPDQTATAGTAFRYAFPDTTFSDADTGDTLSYAATQADGMTLPTWLGFTAGTRTFAGTPAATDVETVSVTVTATDTNSGTVSDDFDIVVSAAPNAAPTASNGTVTTNEDTDHTFAAANFNFADTDSGDSLSSVKIVTLPAGGQGTLTLNTANVSATAAVTKAQLDSGHFKYTPPANANGTGYASFTFKVNDGTVDSSSAYTMTINVTAVNDAPTVATAIPDQTATAGTAFRYAFPDTTFSDADTGDTLSYAVTQADGTNLPTWLGFTAGTRTFAGTPAATDVETVSVTVTATDTNSGTVSDDFNIVVSAAPNAAPTASNGTVTTNEDTDHTFAAANFNFADTDSGDSLSSVKIVTLPAGGKGTLTLNTANVSATAAVTKAQLDSGHKYTPPANANGTGYASFTFKVNDGTVDSSSAYTMTINVTAVNDAPTVATAIPDVETATAR